jgi:hypothetical protein
MTEVPIKPDELCMLSDKEYEAMFWRNQELSFNQIAIEMGCTDAWPFSCVKKAVSKLTPEHLTQYFPHAKESKKYLRAKQMLGRGGEIDMVLKAAQDHGMPKTIVDGVRSRLEARINPTEPEVQNHSIPEFLQLLEDRSYRALKYLDDFNLSAASVKDLAFTINVLIQNAQLLRGMPTQIVDVNDRRKLNELIPMIQEEAKRRGLIIDGTAEHV